MIGYVLKMYPRFSETFVLAEILELERLGRRMRLISLKKPDDGCFHEDLARVRSGVRYLPERFPGHPILFLRAHLRALAQRPVAYLRILFMALRWLPGSWKGFLRAPLIAEEAAASGCTRLHAHFATLPAVSALFAARMIAVPFTFTAHAKDIFLRRRSRRLLRALIIHAERVVTVSEFNRRYMAGLVGADFPENRIVRIYNGVDLERFRPVAGPEDGEPPLILAVGRLVEKKGFTDLVDACAILRERHVRFACEIVGKGLLHDELTRRIAARGLESAVRLVGPLPHGEVARRLSQAALLAVPCVVGEDGNRDGLPTVIPEAMALGVPVIATRVTGIPEAVEDGRTGRLLEPGDPEVLASSMAELLESPALRTRMGEAGRRRAEEDFDLRKNVSRLDRILVESSLADSQAAPQDLPGLRSPRPLKPVSGERPWSEERRTGSRA